MKARELSERLSNIIKDGYGEREIKIMHVESGITQAASIEDCFVSQPYDGELIWIIEKE